MVGGGSIENKKLPMDGRLAQRRYIVAVRQSVASPRRWGKK